LLYAAGQFLPRDAMLAQYMPSSCVCYNYRYRGIIICCVGLTLIANIEQHQYVAEVGTTAGLIVLIHPQNVMPFPEDRGKLVSPGYQTEIAITQVR